MRSLPLRFFIFVVIFAGVLEPRIAFAHTVLVRSNPIARSLIARLPTRVSLTFAEPLMTLSNASINKVLVTDPNHNVISSIRSTVMANVLSNVLNAKKVIPGTYTVSFRVSAQDGHVLTGSYYFKVSAGAKS
jgi:methionine-rich copper-binding protein CopC